MLHDNVVHYTVCARPNTREDDKDQDDQEDQRELFRRTGQDLSEVWRGLVRTTGIRRGLVRRTEVWRGIFRKPGMMEKKVQYFRGIGF